MIAEGPRTESGFSDVDRAHDPAGYVRRLDETGASAFWRMVKQRTFALLDLRAGDRVLDVGCGTGDDVRALARLVGPSGVAAGVDSSATMIAEARRRTEGAGPSTSYYRGDAHHLPFPDGRFDGCRAERVLQHLSQPYQALREMTRVARPGARLVVVEPDYGTQTIDGAERAVTRKILNCRRNHYRCSQIGRQLPGLFKQVGLIDCTVTLLTLSSTDPTLAGEQSVLRKYVAHAQLAGAVTEAEGAKWLADLAVTGASGQYRRAVTIFLVGGRKPDQVA